MKTTGKKFISVLLAVIMVLSVIPMAGVSSFAVISGNFKYEILSETDKTCEITGYTGSATELTIPSAINEYSVTSIGDEAFYGCTSLENVTIPDSVTSIGVNAFYNTAYYNNENNWKNSVLYNGNHLIKAKEDISGSYTIKSGTKTIADNAFYWCYQLTSINIPDGVTSIGDYAFVSCNSFTSVTIPDSVTSIGDRAFSNCTSLTSINVDDNNMNYSSSDGVLFNKIKTELIQYPIGNMSASYIIPDSVTGIGGSAFHYCTSLTSITIPDSVTSIGDFAFSYCVSLTSITIPNSVTEIDECAFYGCASITNITIPDSVTSIGRSAFEGCTSLKSVVIPQGVTGIGEYTFGYYYDDDDNSGYKKIDGFTVYGYEGTTAESYANANNFIFIPLDSSGNISMHRLYNPNSGEHFYTANVSEKDNLVSLGWKYEGIGWTAPITSDKPVYRLYNQNGGEHHYTLDVSERDFLVSLGWKLEDIGWYSADTNGVPLYRQYNTNAFANNHNYTADKAENDWLVSLGWQAEDIGWYGVA